MDEKTILLVDDEADIREVLGIALEDLGYEVHRAADAREALDIFRQVRPPIVFTDIKMPGMDGIGLLSQIKREDPDTEVVMITGHGDMNLAVKSFRENATDFITKPVNVDGLEKTLAQVHEKMALKRSMAEYTRNLESLLFDRTLRLREVEGGGEEAGHGTPLGPVLDRMPCFVSIVDGGLRIVTMNRRLRDTFGQHTGRRCHKVFRRSGEPCGDCPAQKALATGKAHQAEAEYLLEGEDPVRVMVWATPLSESGNGDSAVMLMATRLTEVQELHDHLSSLGLMVGSMSHGIKGLLTGLDGGLFVMNSGLKRQDTGRIEEGAEMVRDTSRRIKKLILDILFYAKERELETMATPVEEFFGEVAKVAEARMRETGCAFTKTCAPECARTLIEIDAGFLSAALVNILENAADACAEVTDGRACGVEFTAAPEADKVAFTVRDTGVGMDEATRAKLFTMFFSTKGHKGTGLGMFVAQKVVAQHGGTIRVESAPGVGTTVCVLIPAAASGGRTEQGERPE